MGLIASGQIDFPAHAGRRKADTRVQGFRVPCERDDFCFLAGRWRDEGALDV